MNLHWGFYCYLNSCYYLRICSDQIHGQHREEQKEHVFVIVPSFLLYTTTQLQLGAYASAFSNIGVCN